jgi:DNA-3-methyladenine glycosylase I
MPAPPPTGLLLSPDGTTRCFWCCADPIYQQYHDTEWGFPQADDHRLFEKICLEGFQAGLSWLTILRKRENVRRAFDGFDFERVARYNARKVDRLLGDAGIIRHRGKIESAINNAKRALELRKEFSSLAAYIWQFEPTPAGRPKHLDLPTLKTMTTSPESITLSKDLKKRGWTFFGPTTAYAFMQSVGLVNDHLDGCGIRQMADRARRRFPRPGIPVEAP